MPTIEASTAAPTWLMPLSRASERVLAQIGGLQSSWGATREELEAALDHLGEDLARICIEGSDTVLPPRSPLVHHRLCEVFRIELLNMFREDGARADEGAARGTLDLLWAVERYRVHLWPDEPEDLPRRLADPDAFELVVGVAHDLRSPLNSILFLSEVLRSGQSGPVTPHQRKQLALIYGATMGLISVANDVMELSRRHDPSEDEEISPFSIGRVYDTVHEMVRPIAEAKGIDLTFELPEFDHCQGRAGPLGRVLLNLTTNALKFTEVGTVTISARRTDRTHVHFSVRDTGRGMTPEMQGRLFQPFQRAASREGHFFAEAGLGLAIARRLVRSMGSDLTVESEVGKGTAFHFTLELPAI